MSTNERPSHADLVEAQRAIFRNADREEAMGIREETEDCLDLHDRFYDLERRAAPFDRRGVWSEAFAAHSEESEGAVHPWVDWQALPADSWWRRRGEAER